jgi:hypothetical protein
MNHSIAECTICAFKGLAVALVYGFFKTQEPDISESQISDDERIIKVKLREE